MSSTRVATLFSRSGASAPALGNATYPTALAGSEEQVYFPCLASIWAFRASVSKDGGGGTTSKLKFQGTIDEPDPLTIGPTAGPGLRLTATTAQTIKLTQQTGTSQAFGYSISGTAVALMLPTDALGQPSGTPAAAAAYIAATLALAAFTVTAVGSGVLGATYRYQTVPTVPTWTDLLSTNETSGTTAIEHTIDAGGAGLTKVVALELQAVGFRALRALATCTGAPAAGDAVTITTMLPG